MSNRKGDSEMNVKKCDRCGDLFGTKEDGIGQLSGDMREIFEREPHLRKDYGGTKDLCAVCVSSFTDWWNGNTYP